MSSAAFTWLLISVAAVVVHSPLILSAHASISPNPIR